MGNKIPKEVTALKTNTAFFDVIEEDIDGNQVRLGDFCEGKVTFCINVASN